ncbi:MAG: hypothetical protein D8M59_06090 [Planctomycetes bacterium]|nr:hypothetical protein [Planctomycetota bacterium]NOG55067.1 glycosyltransferase family 9 protein [Planctomycetota bacterium]
MPHEKVKKIGRILVLHQAALGDFVLIWPFIRRLGAVDVTVVTDLDKARLAKRYLPELRGIRDIESPLWNVLWRRLGLGDEWLGEYPQVELIESFISEPGSIWHESAGQVFPNARITHHQTKPPVRVDDPAFQPVIQQNPGGPIVFHVGAGSNAKRWPIVRSIELAEALDHAVLIAGEVEQERFTRTERAAFTNDGGRFCDSLDALGDVIESARLFIGFDSGPTHLAAQIGIPTMALFGPTDPGVWAPIGPAVRVIAPDTPTAMDWLSPSDVLHRLLQD